MAYLISPSLDKVVIRSLCQETLAVFGNGRAEFYGSDPCEIPGCSFEMFQTEAGRRGYEIRDIHRPLHCG
jgi:hypothetical protein